MEQRLSTLLRESGRLLKSATDFRTALRQDHNLILCCTSKPRRNLYPLSHNLILHLTLEVYLTDSFDRPVLIQTLFWILEHSYPVTCRYFYRHFLVHMFSFPWTSPSSIVHYLHQIPWLLTLEDCHLTYSCVQ